jgi:NitT/TauT family transport system permease protein
MALNLLAGFRSIPPIYRDVGRNIGLKPLQNTGLIMIPAAVPFLLAGLKIGWARAWRALISAEMIFGAAGGEGGLGWFIFKRRVFMDTPGIYAGILVIVVIGILVEDGFFRQIERLTVKKWGMSN